MSPAEGKDLFGGKRVLDVEPLLGCAQAAPEDLLLVGGAPVERRRRLDLRVCARWKGLAGHPDWVCEVLSPATVPLDRIKKVPLYASFAIPRLLLVDPLARTLEVLKLTGGQWALLAAHSEDEKVRYEPFHEIEIDLALLWP
ncbi:MAG: Uma2 family endonuclease [bacterium]